MILPLLIALHSADLTAKDVLDHVRAAVALEASPSWQEVQVEGKATFRGVPCTYTMRYRPNGQYVQSMRGDLMGGFGFDGRRHWQVDPSGFPRNTWHEDAYEAEAVNSILSNRWLRDGALDLAVLLAASGPDIVLLAKEWGNQLSVAITIDSQTWLPKAVKIETHSGSTRIDLGSWGLAGKEKIPFNAQIDQDGEVAKLEVNHAATSDTVNPSSYSMPSAIPTDSAYDPSIKPEVESKTVRGHLFVHPMVNGKDIGWFILDTCAEVMMIDEHIADSISLQKLGGSAITGIGGTIVEPYRRASELTLGPAKIHNITFSQLDATFLTKAFGITVAGIVGADVLKRFVVTIDVEKPTVAIADRSSYRLPSGAWLPLIFLGGNPAVEGIVEGDRRGWIELDTGSNSQIMIDSPFVREQHLLDDRKTQANQTGGFGGTATTRLGTLEWLELAGHRFTNVQAEFSLAEHGALANRDLIGIIGQPLMKPFTIVYDFAGYRAAFVPK